jgi:hypothetical protein
MLSMMKALRPSMTRCSSCRTGGGGASCSTLPRLSVIFWIRCGVTLKPPLANTA